MTFVFLFDIILIVVIHIFVLLCNFINYINIRKVGYF